MAFSQPPTLLSSEPSVNGQPEPPGSSVPLDERTIIYVTALGHAVCHIGELVFAGAMLALMVEFQLEPHEATVLALLGYVLLGFGALPVGIWADSWGPTRVLMIYFLAMAVAGVAVALAPNVWLLFVGLTTLGLAASIYHPTGLAMLSLGVRREARGRAMGINGVAGSIGVATGPTLGMLAASLGWGMWRLAYVAVAVLALIAAGLMWLASRKPSCGAAKGSGVFFRKVDVCSSESPLVPKKDFRPLLSLASLAFLFAAMTFGGFNYRCLVTGLPALLSGESAAAGQLILGGLMTFIALVAGGIGQYGGGWLADRFGSRRIYVMLIGMLVLLAMLLGTLDGSALALPVACLLAVSLFGQQPVENSLLAECTSAGRRGASYGVKFALTFGLGALGAYVAGLVWHHFEAVGPVFYLLAGSATMMGLLALGYLALAGVGSSDDLRAGRVSDGHASVAYASGSEPNPSALESPS